MVGDPSNDIPAAAPGVTADSVGSVVGSGEPPLDLGYTVTVDSFSGPLDLLLYLVRRTELDILEVPLSLIVDQFVDTVRSWQDADLDVAGEFILMAATLLELKARTIAPPLEQAEEGAEDEPAFDPRESLLKSLLAYRRFKEASQLLDGLEERRQPLLERQVREHIPEAPPEEGDFELGEIDLSVLATTCERILSRIGGLGPRTVVVDEMPLGVRIATMLDALTARERATMRELLQGNHSRVVHITTVMATLELARQRFIEVTQYEQFGDIALRLRTAEEREREPQLPPPESEGPRRRRKLPLVTWHPPAESAESAGAAVASADDDTAAEPAIEESNETDEQRFLREIEEATRVTAVLALTADVEKSFTEHWYALHPELRPAAPATPPPPEPVAKRFPQRRPPNERRVVEKPPAETPASEVPLVSGAVASAAAIPAETLVAPAPSAPAAAELVPLKSAGDATLSVATTSASADTAPVVPDESVGVVVVTPTLAEAVTITPTPPAEGAARVFTQCEPAAMVATSEPVAEATAATLSDAAEVAQVTPASAAESLDAAVSASVVTTADETSQSGDVPPAVEPITVATAASREPQHVLPVDQWPVMYAQPVAEETPHPLDTVTSDDPSAVNELLSDAPRRSAPRDDDERDDDSDADELLADDPALVNAALQADKLHQVIERRPVPEVVIPVATETSVWTAPIDRGQTANEIDVDDEVSVVTPSALAEETPMAADSVASSSVTEQPAAPATTADALASAVAAPRETTSAGPIRAEQSAEDIPVAPAGPPTAALLATDPASSTTTDEPTLSTEPLVVAAPTMAEAAVAKSPEAYFQSDEVDDFTAADPALVDAAEQANFVYPPDVPRPVPELVIPAATETTIYTAPVDHGQTTSDDEAELESASTEERVTVSSDVPDNVAASAAAMPNEAASGSAVVSSKAVEAEAPAKSPLAVNTVMMAVPAAIGSEAIAEAKPATAALALSEPRSQPVTAKVETPVVERLTPLACVEPSPPPNEAPPPGPAGPPPVHRFDSPLPAPTTTPTPNRPMSPPPRSKAWPLIALVVAINAGWALGMWLTWVPRDVLEVIATERGGAPEHETLTWRFNLDVIDAQDLTKGPQLVPAITPSVAGRWSWSDPRTLVFEAASPLPFATTFTAALPTAEFRTAHGFRLRSPAQQSWSTPALSVSGATVETFDQSGTTIALSFNQSVNPLEIAQRLQVEVTPVAPISVDAGNHLPAPVSGASASFDQAVAAPTTPAVVNAPVFDAPTVDSMVAVTAPVDPETTSNATVTNPAPASAAALVDTVSIEPAAPTVTVVPAAPITLNTPSAQPTAAAPLVRALSNNADRTIRLLIASPQRGSARLRLDAGTTGIAGPLGLEQTWEQAVALQQTLQLVSATAAAPSHGAIRIDVAVSDAQAPRQLLAPAISVEPPVPVTVSTTDQGISLVGEFIPGETYRVRSAATWPDEPSTSGHQLAAYTAASDLSVTIPARPAGIWSLDDGLIDGQVRFAAHALERADVMLLGAEDECLASSEATWTGTMPALLDLDALTAELPPATYRLRVASTGDTPVISEQTLVIEHVRLRPQDLIAGLTDWMLAALAGDDLADVPVRLMRLGDLPPVTLKSH